MPRYIDADALMRLIPMEEIVARMAIANAPTADVVEVVRCKDCKWFKLSGYNTFGIHVCSRFSGVRGEHDFCSRGERKE